MTKIPPKEADTRKMLLIVDDYEGTREVYTNLFSREGLQVAFAGDGLEAFDKAVELQPDAIFMDLSLPTVNGWEATRRLKADHRTKEIPVVMLTAHELESARPELIKAGFAGLLTKPCSPKDMLAELARVLGQPPAPGV